MPDTLTPEQLESLNRHLAEKVMGWHEKELGNNTSIYPAYFDKLGAWKIYVRDFDPPYNIEQAMGCFGKIRSGYIAFDERLLYKCNVVSHEGVFAEAEGKEPESAISLACAKATGWKDD